MSFLTVVPGFVSDAAADLARLGSTLEQANATAAASTTGVVTAAGDEVSAAIASLFSTHGAAYQAVSGQVAAFHDEFVQLLSAGAGQYAAAEAAAADPLLAAINAPALALTGRPFVGDGVNGVTNAQGFGTAGGSGGWIFGNGGAGGDSTAVGADGGNGGAGGWLYGNGGTGGRGGPGGVGLGVAPGTPLQFFSTVVPGGTGGEGGPGGLFGSGGTGGIGGAPGPAVGDNPGIAGPGGQGGIAGRLWGTDGATGASGQSV